MSLLPATIRNAGTRTLAEVVEGDVEGWTAELRQPVATRHDQLAHERGLHGTTAFRPQRDRVECVRVRWWLCCVSLKQLEGVHEFATDRFESDNAPSFAFRWSVTGDACLVGDGEAPLEAAGVRCGARTTNALEARSLF